VSNMIKRGSGESSFWECTGGPQDLSETIANTALTGTVALTSGTTVVLGTGTLFTTELHLGQSFLVIDATAHRSFPCVVERIVSNLIVVISRAPSASVSGKTGYRLPIMFAVDSQRGTALWGNVVRLDNGTLFSVGDGTFRLDGSALSATLALTRKPKVSRLSAGTYSHFSLGLPVPAKPTLANVAGGTKGMQAATYGVVVTAERIETAGYGNPSLVATVTIAAGERVEIDFGAFDAPSGSNAWGVWGTRYVDSLDSGKNYLNGPWFRVMCGSGDNGQVIAGDLTANKITTEWLDAEIETGDLITFNNDAPSDAEFVALFNGVPVYVGTDGPGDTSPGPFIRPAKPSNIEAAPAELAYPTSPPEQIIGVTSALGKLYLLTTGHLQVAIGTGRDDIPVLIQPHWKGGFKNPYQLDFVNGVLYGNTTAGPSRSVGEGDEQEAERTWAAYIGEYSKDWVTGHVMVRHDPLNDAMCYFHSAYSLNSSGYWTTRVWMWGLTQQQWIGDILLTSTTADMVVSGVATVGDYLEFLCGGRQSNDTVVIKTYRFDTATGTSVPYYIVPELTDYRSEERPHVVKALRATGKFTSASLKVYGARPTEVINVSDLESGANALATIPLSDSSNVVEGKRNTLDAKNLSVSTFRLEGTWNGSGIRDRVDELFEYGEIQGARR
jgi:hypothetical protein